MDMKNTHANYYAMEFIEEEGKTFVLFYDSEDNLVDKREIPQQDVNDAIRARGDNN